LGAENRPHAVALALAQGQMKNPCQLPPVRNRRLVPKPRPPCPRWG
jgi:hypothetical protein